VFGVVGLICPSREQPTRAEIRTIDVKRGGSHRLTGRGPDQHIRIDGRVKEEDRGWTNPELASKVIVRVRPRAKL
jgi:hypothetical protein